MAVIQYSLVAHDWLNLEYIINDLTRRVVGQELHPTSSPTFGEGTITGDLAVGGSFAVTGDFEVDGSLTLNDLDASEFVFTDAGKSLVSVNVPLVVAYGGSGAATFTDHSLLVGSGTDPFTALGVATNGQLPIGSTGADPVLATLTEGDNITITNEAGSITIAADDVDFADYITGTANQITVTDDGDDTVTLSTPQDLDTSCTFQCLTVNGLTLGYTTTDNIAIGDSTTLDALDDNPTYNIAIGGGAGSGLTDGDNNIFIGYRAGYEKTTAVSNIAIGYEAWYKGSGNYAVAIGYQAGRYHSTGNNNVLIGHQAGLGDPTGAAYVYNTIVGSGAGVNLETNGSYNTFLGYYSGNDNTTGASNVFLGIYSGSRQTTNSNLLIVDNQDRTNAAGELANSLIYGTFAAAAADQTLALNATVSAGNLYPRIDDTYYLGKNDDDTPFAWKGIILKDQGGTGKYYRLEINGDALQIVDLTD